MWCVKTVNVYNAYSVNQLIASATPKTITIV